MESYSSVQFLTGLREKVRILGTSVWNEVNVVISQLIVYSLSIRKIASYHTTNLLITLSLGLRLGIGLVLADSLGSIKVRVNTGVHLVHHVALVGTSSSLATGVVAATGTGTSTFVLRLVEVLGSGRTLATVQTDNLVTASNATLVNVLVESVNTGELASEVLLLLALIAVDARVGLVSDVAAMRTGSRAGRARGAGVGGVVATSRSIATGRSTKTRASAAVSSTAISVTVEARVGLVGDVAVVSSVVGRTAQVISVRGSVASASSSICTS